MRMPLRVCRRPTGSALGGSDEAVAMSSAYGREEPPRKFIVTGSSAAIKNKMF